MVGVGFSHQPLSFFLSFLVFQSFLLLRELSRLDKRLCVSFEKWHWGRFGVNTYVFCICDTARAKRNDRNIGEGGRREEIGFRFLYLLFMTKLGEVTLSFPENLREN